MTIERIENDMITALKNGDKERRSVLSMILSTIKKEAIDSGKRNSIDEQFVDSILTKYEKNVKETIAELAKSNSTNAMIAKEHAENELAIVREYAPVLITDKDEILTIIANSGIEVCAANRGKIMKYLSANYKGKMDMSIASKLIC